MEIAIIKYNAGNIRSVAFALDRLQVNYEITNDPEKIMGADRVIFPGVGEANTTMEHLIQQKLDQVIVSLKQPVLGICLGMQLMCQYSEENSTTCLGIFDEKVKHFKAKPGLKVPHMGWNALSLTNGWLDPKLEGQFVYFVHSYYVPLNPYTSAKTTYDIEFSSALRKNNFFAVQFHPEKSADVGNTVLQNFLNVQL